MWTAPKEVSRLFITCIRTLSTSSHEENNVNVLATNLKKIISFSPNKSSYILQRHIMKKTQNWSFVHLLNIKVCL